MQHALNAAIPNKVHFVELELRFAQHRLDVVRDSARFFNPHLQCFVRELVVGDIVFSREFGRIVVDDLRVLEEGKAAVARLAVPFAGKELHFQASADVRLVERALVVQVVLLVCGVLPRLVPCAKERAGVVRGAEEDDAAVDVEAGSLCSGKAERFVPRKEIVLVDMLVQHDVSVEDSRRLIFVFFDRRQVSADDRVAVDVEEVAVHIIGNRRLDEARAFRLSRVRPERNRADFRGKLRERAALSAQSFFRRIVAEHDDVCARHLEAQRPDGHERLLVVEVVFRRDEDVDVFHFFIVALFCGMF